MHGPQGQPRSHLIFRRLHSEHDKALPLGGSVAELAFGEVVGLELPNLDWSRWATALAAFTPRPMGGPMLWKEEDPMDAEDEDDDMVYESQKMRPASWKARRRRQNLVVGTDVDV
jgi:hypothetical protein